MKARTFIPLALLALACSSKSDDKGKGGSGATGGSGSGGSSASGGSGGTIVVSGGSSGTSTGGSSATSGSSGNGTITMETAADLRAKACAGQSTEPELLPIVLMLVVDNSLSMNERPRNSQQTKWEITSAALATAIDTMPSTAAVGLLFYPNMNTSGSDDPRPVDSCVNVNAMIPIEVLGDQGSNQRDRIARALDDTRPAGSTPTHDAYDYAYWNGMEASDATGNRFMMLITDGAPTLGWQCTGGGLPTTPAPTQPIVDEVLTVREAGVRSFIIGSPGSESIEVGNEVVDVRPWLAEAAVNGATAPNGCSLAGPDYCHIDLSQDPNFASALNAALSRILGIITSCTFDVPVTAPGGGTVQPGQINVIYTPGDGSDEILIGKDDSPDCTDGWQFDAQGRVVLCPNTCAVAQNDPAGTIELLFGCESVDVEPVK
jgi:hypothetical protein